jgi:hypothetical protein
MPNYNKISLDQANLVIKKTGVVMKIIRVNYHNLKDDKIAYAIEHWVKKIAALSKSRVDWHFDDDDDDVILIKALGDIALVELTIDELESELNEIRSDNPNVLPVE